MKTVLYVTYLLHIKERPDNIDINDLLICSMFIQPLLNFYIIIIV